MTAYRFSLLLPAGRNVKMLKMRKNEPAGRNSLKIAFLQAVSFVTLLCTNMNQPASRHFKSINIVKLVDIPKLPLVYLEKNLPAG